MRTIPSAEFRKTYGKLTEPTIVTVNGHAIGRWNPIGTDGLNPDSAMAPPVFVDTWGPTFRPVPKPGKRK